MPYSKSKYLATIKPIIKNIFKIEGVAAPTQKLPLVFKLAENRAVKTINIKYGKITFAYGIVNSNRSKLSENPGAINKIILGINSSDKITRGNTISNINEAILLVKLSLPPYQVSH